MCGVPAEMHRQATGAPIEASGQRGRLDGRDRAAMSESDGKPVSLGRLLCGLFGGGAARTDEEYLQALKDADLALKRAEAEQKLKESEPKREDKPKCWLN